MKPLSEKEIALIITALGYLHAEAPIDPGDAQRAQRLINKLNRLLKP